MKMVRTLLPLLLLAAPLAGQTADTVIVPREVVDSTADSVKVIRTITVLQDSLFYRLFIDTVFDTVITIRPVPPPVGNMPGNVALVGLHTFGQKVEAGFWDRGDAAYSIVQDAQRGSVGQAFYRAGFSGGRGPINVLKTFRGSPTIYVSFWLKLSPYWDGHASGVNKVLHIWNSGPGKRSNRLMFAVYGKNTGALQAQIRMQGLAEVPNTREIKSQAFVPRGAWTRVELLLTGNTNGLSNGIATFWIDGRQAGSASNIRFTSGSPIWEEVSWNPTWGGAGDVLTASQTMDVDDLYVAAGP